MSVGLPGTTQGGVSELQVDNISTGCNGSLHYIGATCHSDKNDMRQ